ncbi:MAG TPA: hypothetical protein DGT21_00710 [Armatimonadetes bacterium]|nr:hypothetical protein [Armatimonadota bacterium]
MQSPITRAVVLIGGLGTRLRPLTYQRPKALLPLLNRPLIAYEIELFARHGVTDLVMAVAYGAEAIRAELGDGARWGVRLHYVEEKQRLDTAGAIRNAAHLLEGPFFACNGDLVYDVDLGVMARAHLDAGALVTFCLRAVEDISAYGLIQCDEAGRVTAFKEKVAFDETGRNTVNSGFYAMAPEVLEAIPEHEAYSNETQLFPCLLEAGRPLYGWVAPPDVYWSDVGRMETYLQTHSALLGGAVSWVTPGINSAVEAGVSIFEPVDIAVDVEIEPGCRIGPGVALGPGCRIGVGSVIENSILWPAVTVGAGVHISNAVLASGVRVPDHSRINDEVLVPENG